MGSITLQLYPIGNIFFPTTVDPQWPPIKRPPSFKWPVIKVPKINRKEFIVNKPYIKQPRSPFNHPDESSRRRSKISTDQFPKWAPQGSRGVQGHAPPGNFLGFWIIQTGYWLISSSLDKALQIGWLFSSLNINMESFLYQKYILYEKSDRFL